VICICNIVQKICVKSSVKISPLILFWWKTWQWSAILVSETMYLLKVKQCINNQISDSGSREPLVCKILLDCSRYRYEEGRVWKLWIPYLVMPCHIFEPVYSQNLYFHWPQSVISVYKSLKFDRRVIYIYIVVVGFILLDIILYNFFVNLLHREKYFV
jgi:hypothetical protein